MLKHSKAAGEETEERKASQISAPVAGRHSGKSDCVEQRFSKRPGPFGEDKVPVQLRSGTAWQRVMQQVPMVASGPPADRPGKKAIRQRQKGKGAQ